MRWSLIIFDVTWKISKGSGVNVHYNCYSTFTPQNQEKIEINECKKNIKKKVHRMF